MNKTCKFAIVIGAGLALAPWVAFAQTQANQPSTASVSAPATSAVIPLDQQPTKEQLAKLFEVMRLRQQLQDYFTQGDVMAKGQAMAQFHEVFTRMCNGCSLTPGQSKTIDNMMSRYVAKLVSVYPVSERIDDIFSIYQRHLSRTDVDALVGFYSSPAGQHMLNEKPAILQEYLTEYAMRMKGRSAPIADELAQEMQKVIDSQAPPADKPAAR